eukprot:290649-Prymnesium_polylepis.1
MARGVLRRGCCVRGPRREGAPARPVRRRRRAVRGRGGALGRSSRSWGSSACARPIGNHASSARII